MGHEDGELVDVEADVEGALEQVGDP